MSSSENDGSNKQAAGNDVQGKANIYEDEINLIDYFRVLWKRKRLLLWGSVLPTFVVGLIIFLWPRYYKTTYLYNTGLDEKNYKILLDQFYCAENLEKIINRLNENGLGKYAQQVAGAGGIQDLKKFINLEVSPSFFEAAGSSGTDIEKLQKIQQARGTLLSMTIEGKPQKDMYPTASVVRDDFEKVIPIYSVKDELSNNIEALKTNMAKIEEDRFGIGLELERKKATLEKLKNLKSGDSGNIQSNIVLQFNDVNASSAYLPLAYQIQAVNSQIINLEESVKANEERYNYCKGLLTVNERLFDEVKSKIPLYYRIQEFHSFLDNIVKDYKDKELIDYLNAYIKSIENKMANTVPLIEKPKIYPVTKGTAKKSGIVFVIALMLSVFTAFLLEGLKKSQVKTS